MLAKLDLPEELLEALPSDPFEQLDVARKITSIALSTRVDALESELSALREQLIQRDDVIAGLESQLQSLDASLADASHKLDSVQHEKESLTIENSQLSSKVKKLNQDVAKLEAFRKTLMRSLNDEDEDNPTNAPKPSPQLQPSKNNEEGSELPTNQTALNTSPFTNGGDTETEAVKPSASQGLLQTYQTSTPTPGSPPSLSASITPSRTPKPLSPRRHSISFSTSRSFQFDNTKSSVYSSSPFSSMSSADSGSQSGKTRVDGKEFFRHVRSRLTYEQFAAFLANVKELNAMKQTKEETLQKAGDIFGAENKDLYVIFEGLIMRNVH